MKLEGRRLAGEALLGPTLEQLKERLPVWLRAALLLVAVGSICEASFGGQWTKFVVSGAAVQVLGIVLLWWLTRRISAKLTLWWGLLATWIYLAAVWGWMVWDTRKLLILAVLICLLHGLTSLVLVRDWWTQTIFSAAGSLTFMGVAAVLPASWSEFGWGLAFVLVGVAFGYGVLSMLKKEFNKAEETRALMRALPASLGHELRSQAGAIAMRAALLRESASDRELSGSLEAIEAAALRILNVTENLCDALQLETGQMSVRPRAINPNQVVADAASELAATARTRDVEVEVSLDPNLPTVWVDPNYFKRVTANLLDNVLRAAPKGGRVVVKTAFSDQWVRVSFGGAGLAFNWNSTPKVFSEAKISLADAVRENFGLVVAKRMAELCGGEVVFEGNPGGETKFTLNLPHKPYSSSSSD